MYLVYDEDSTEEWAAVSLFGDTVQPIPKPIKKIRHNTKDKKKKQDQVEGTEKFHTGRARRSGWDTVRRSG